MIPLKKKSTYYIYCLVQKTCMSQSCISIIFRLRQLVFTVPGFYILKPFLGVQKLKEYICGFLKINPNKQTQRVPDHCLISKAQAVSKENHGSWDVFHLQTEGVESLTPGLLVRLCKILRRDSEFIITCLRDSYIFMTSDLFQDYCLASRKETALHFCSPYSTEEKCL